ncbi:MAG: flagellar motor protein MotB [Myxococcota bacterium]
MRMLRPRPVTRRNESWQVIYMDLMTTIMIFFVILWSINQRQDFGVSETVGEETVKMVDLPGDILFASGRSDMSRKGQTVFKKLFSDNTGAVLNFDTGGLVKRLLVIHGHTDGDGDRARTLNSVINVLLPLTTR